MRVSKAEREQAIERLRECVKRGDDLICSTEYARSGMTRWVKIYVCRPAIREVRIHTGKRHENGCAEYRYIKRWVGDLLWLTYNVSLACGYTFDRKREGLRIGGCGFSASNSIAMDLSRVLFGNDYDLSYRDI